MKLRPEIVFAATLLLGSVTPIATAAPVDLSSGSAGFFNTPGAGSFTDSYTFTLASNQSVNVMLSSVIGGSQNVDFTSIVLAGTGGNFAASLLTSDPFESWIIDSAALTPGSYTLTAIGINSAAIGSYAGTIALSGSSTAFGTTNGGPLDLSSGSTGFASTPLAGAFSDKYTFTLATAQAVNVLISSVVGGSQDVDFSGITITGPSVSFSGQALTDGTFENWSLNTPVLNPGSYTLTSSGSNSAAVGSYVGSVAISASGVTTPPNAIPEPGGWALMLAGLGALHATMRRRLVVAGGTAPSRQTLAARADHRRGCW